MPREVPNIILSFFLVFIFFMLVFILFGFWILTNINTNTTNLYNLIIFGRELHTLQMYKISAADHEQ